MALYIGDFDLDVIKLVIVSLEVLEKTIHVSTIEGSNLSKGINFLPYKLSVPLDKKLSTKIIFSDWRSKPPYFTKKSKTLPAPKNLAFSFGEELKPAL